MIHILLHCWPASLQCPTPEYLCSAQPQCAPAVPNPRVSGAGPSPGCWCNTQPQTVAKPNLRVCLPIRWYGDMPGTPIRRHTPASDTRVRRDAVASVRQPAWTPRHRYVSRPIRRYAASPTRRCAAWVGQYAGSKVPRCRGTLVPDMPARRYAGKPTCRHVDMHRYADTLVRRYANTPVCRKTPLRCMIRQYVGMTGRRNTGARRCWYANTPVRRHRSTGTPICRKLAGWYPSTPTCRPYPCIGAVVWCIGAVSVDQPQWIPPAISRALRSRAPSLTYYLPLFEA